MTPGAPAPRVARAQRTAADGSRPRRANAPRVTTTTRAQAVPAATPRRPRAQPRAATKRRTEHSTLASVADSPLTSYYLVAGVTTALLGIGLIMVLSSSAITEIANGRSPYAVFVQQAQFALLGLPLLLIAARLPLRVYKRLAWPGLFAAMALQALTLTALADSANGNAGWVVVGGFRFQPAEIAKLALAVWLATVLGRKQRLLGSSWHALIPAVPGVLVVIALVLAGQDLGTTLIIIMLVVGAMFVAGVPVRLLAFGGALGAALIVWFLILGGQNNRAGRISSTFAGCSAQDVQGACWQVLQGLQALGTGGLSGVGLGASREKWQYLPEPHNDFIFAVIGEELGLFGTLTVLALIGVLGFACIRIVRRHRDPFAKIAAAAIGCWVVGQALVNIGVVIGIIPVMGVPLPLVSAGGSALISTMVAMGVLLALARTEPGAPEALAARPSVARRSLAVVSGAGRRARRRR